MIGCLPCLLAVLALADVPEVSVRIENEEALCTIKAHQVGVDELLRELASKCGREVVGLDPTWQFDPIDVELVDRPLDLVVDGLAGAAGLRAKLKPGAIAVRPDLDASASVADLEDLAEVMFVRALRRFPEAEGAPQAEMRLGQIQESRHHDMAARAHYDGLVRAHPDSPLVDDALLRSATLHQRQGEWSEAATRWSQLANRPAPNPNGVKARVELARCMAFQGDGRQALALIEALDRTMPPSSLAERAERLYVRAAALVSADRGVEALETLDKAMQAGLDQAALADSVRLRADAFDRAGMPGEAARSWLGFAKACGDERKKGAYLRAARSASAAGDLLGVLFIEREALGSGAEAEIVPLSIAARDGLGFAPKPVDIRLVRLQRAEEQCQSGAFEDAGITIAYVWRERVLLEEVDLVRAALVRARCKEASEGIEAAIADLRALLEEVKRPENRNRVYLLAGELYERRSQWDLAAQAYGGRL